MIQKNSNFNIAKSLIEDEVFNSLKESFNDTLMRDINCIKEKLLFFYGNKANDNFYELELKNYDLWGPFFFLIFLSAFLSFAHGNSAEQNFSLLIIVQIISSLVIIINMKLLKIRMSYMQGFSLVGYLTFPFVPASLLTATFQLVSTIFKLPLAMTALFFSCRASLICCKQIVTQDKTYMIHGPLVIYFLILSSFVICL